MMDYWADFARTGEPDIPDAGLPLWHAWSNEPGAFGRMVFDAGLDHVHEMQEDFHLLYSCLEL